VPHPTPRTIADRFREIAAAHPDRPALSDAHRSLTYREVDLATNAAAHGILGLDGDGPVVVVAPVDLDSVLLTHGALKAGRMVVPLDPRWPPEQWLEVTRSTGGVLVVPDVAVRDQLPERSRAAVHLAADVLDGPTTDPGIVVDPDAPAFIFFTSGSTGAPKGTVLGHRIVDGSQQLLGLVADDRLAVVAPLSFVTGALAALVVLVTGASGHLFDAQGADPLALAHWLDDRGITQVALSPTMIGIITRFLAKEGRTIDSLRLVAQGGEVGTPEHFTIARRGFPNARFKNAYGMTETGGPVCDHEVDVDRQAGDEPVPVGRPMPGVRIDVVDDDGDPVPDGEDGEIWVTTSRAAFGYWDQPALTQERFVINDDGLRTVRTGDRGRYRADGALEHLGRLDRQVKVHGQTVDLSQVERELEHLAEVRGAVVSSVPTDDGGHRIVAHVVLELRDGSDPVTVATLRRGLRTRLPHYAIPRVFFRIDEMPQMLTGKVDRSWLRESSIGALPLETEYVAPRNARERSVARLFEEVLAVDRVGVHDDFFELGGDSLAAVDLLAGVAEQFGLELSATNLLLRATVEAVAARLDEDHVARAELVVRVNRGVGRSLFCVPGAADTPVQLRPLGRRLDEVTLYGFGYRGVDHRAVPDLTVAAIARRNITAMREVDPVGPYRLFGYSFGGAVALTMAQQLAESGADVELLVLLEPTLWPNKPWDAAEVEPKSDFRKAHARAAAATPGTSPRDRLTRLRLLAGSATRHVRRQAQGLTAGIVVRRGLEQHDAFMRFHSWVMRMYRARPYDGRTAVLASSRYLEHMRHELDVLLLPEGAGGRRTDIAVPGEHLELVREPSVAAVARAVDLLLAADPA
jgi:acyl-CoA synthetase (AMP-forming)/AMP-acid ligase II/thioesterase domain-containing protein/acyl carrier protein